MNTSVLTTLRQQIEEAFAHWEQRPDSLEHRLLRLSVPIAPVNIYDWLAAQTAPNQVLWKGKRADWKVAGVGQADLVSGGTGDDFAAVLRRCRKYMSGAESVRYYGGFSFQPESADDVGWRAFGPARFVLPRFEVSGAELVCNLLFRVDHPCSLKEVQAELAALNWDIPSEHQRLPRIMGREDFPDAAGWEGNVLSALAMIESEVLEKIVLARRADYEFEQAATAAQILAKLSRVTSNCFHFLLQPNKEAAFMGTTPERLFFREARSFRSEVIAGTRGRSDDEVEDARLSAALLASEKDQREHDIVRKAMRQKLHLLCDALQVQEQAELLKLERKQHLISPIEGVLSEGRSDADLLDRLHPTPAVGGYPRENALREIPQLEPFCRGWYAAPVGWVSEDASEFAVAIRSGLVQGRKVSVYSGAGIVQGSVPKEEWDEIENKISDFVKVTQ